MNFGSFRRKLKRRLKHRHDNIAAWGFFGGFLGCFVAVVVAVLFVSNVFSFRFLLMIFAPLCLLNAFLLILGNWLADSTRFYKLIVLNLILGFASILKLLLGGRS